MEKFIPYEKLSKKKRRALNAKRREVWLISPITRKPENPKAYNRKKHREGILMIPALCLFFFSAFCIEQNRSYSCQDSSSGPVLIFYIAFNLSICYNFFTIQYLQIAPVFAAVA